MDGASAWLEDSAEQGRAGVTDRAAARGDTRLLLVAVAASVILHGLLLLVLLSRNVVSTPTAAPLAVQMRLVPTNPQRRFTPAEVTAPDSPDPEPSPILPERVSERSVTAPVPERPISERENRSPNEAPPRVIEQPFVTVPSVAHIRQTLDGIQTTERERALLYACNPLEEEAGVLECGDRDLTSYDALTRNPVYRALNPVRELSPGARSVTTIHSETAALTSRLSASAIDPTLRDYVIAELEAGVSVFSNNAATPGRQIRRMADRSAAALQAERVLGDGWVQEAARKLVQRRVTSD